MSDEYMQDLVQHLAQNNEKDLLSTLLDLIKHANTQEGELKVLRHMYSENRDKKESV